MQDKTRNERGQTLEEFLGGYDPNRYQHPSVTVDMAVFTVAKNVLSVVLIKRRDHPNIGRWALPGGFIEMGETLAQSAARELCEETGLCGVPLHPIGMFGEPTRDPRTRIITAAFAAYAPHRALSIAAGDDAADARLFSVALERRGTVETGAKRAPACDIALPCTSCGEAYEKEGELYVLTLTNGAQTLCARLAIAKTPDGLGKTAVLLPSDAPAGLAGDHALIVFAALRDLAERNTSKAAKRMETEPYILECALAALK